MVMKPTNSKSNQDVTGCGCGCGCAEAQDNSQELDASRRSTLKWLLLSLPIVKSFAAAVPALANEAEPVSAEVEAQKSLMPQVGDRLTYFAKSKRGHVFKASDLKTGAKQILTLPMSSKDGIVRDGSRYNQILLQRFDASELSADTAKFAADGVVAYSAICTHNGCPVTAWNREGDTYMCPCHMSEFNPRNSAAVAGGPAPRALPALPLRIENDEIVVAGEFSHEVGFGESKG